MAQLSRDVTVLIRRREKLEQLQSALGDNWELFDIDGVLPAVMKKRKDVLLRHKTVDNKYMFDYAVELNKPHEGLRKVVSVEHSCYLWDFGLLAVDVRITLRMTSPDALLNVYPFAEAFEEEMLAKDMYKPPGCDSWDQVQEMFTSAFAKAHMKTIHWLTSPEAPSYLLETCCWNLIMVEDKKNGVAISKQVLEQCLEEFCGTNTNPECFDTGVSEFVASHTGYSGNVAILINADEAFRVEWLYKVVAILYSALLESTEPCYDLVTRLIQEEGSSPRSVGEIRLVQKIIDLLHAEANPIVICSESFDAEIYDKVWNCWGGDAIDALVDKRTEFLMHTLNDLSEQKSQNLQMRLNFVVFILTLVSVASTIAAIIDLLDVGDRGEAEWRAVVLGILTGIVGLACAIVVSFDVSGCIARLRRSTNDSTSGSSDSWCWPSSSVYKKKRALFGRRNSQTRHHAPAGKSGEMQVKVVGDD